MKRITILLMAAGQSSRMGQNKLLLPFQGQSVLRRTAMSLIENNFKNILVVTGHESARAHTALERLPVEWVHNSDHQSGLLSSVKAGIKACSETTDAVMIVLADQVFLNPQHVRALVEFYEKASQALTAPRYGDESGHPVIIPREYFQQILDRDESPEKGAQFLFQKYTEAVRTLNFPASKESQDLDTPEDYAKLTQEEADSETKNGSEFGLAQLQQEMGYQNLQNQREVYS